MGKLNSFIQCMFVNIACLFAKTVEANTERDLSGQKVNARLRGTGIWVLCLWAVLSGAPAIAEDLKGTVISVDGSTVTVETEIVEGLTPAVGDTVTLVQSLEGGRMKMPAGRWVVERVNGVFLTAIPGNDVRQPPERGMEAIIHLSRGRDYRSGPDVFVPGDAASTPRGKVVMVRGNLVTIELDTGVSGTVPEPGDQLTLMYTVAGEPIEIGTWQVSVVKEKGTLEAEPVTMKREPTLGLQAVFLPRKGRDVGAGESGTMGRGKAEPLKENESVLSRQIERSRETDITRNLGELGSAVPCSGGTVNVRGNVIEMTAAKQQLCTVLVSAGTLEDLHVSVKLGANTDDYRLGVIFGPFAGDRPGPGSLQATVSVMTAKVSSGFFNSKTVKTSWLEVNRIGTGGFDQPLYKSLPESDDPPGLLELIKSGPDCRLTWNGKEVGAWMETESISGELRLFFQPIKEKARAVFEDLHVRRLD